jgi:F-type H+-transporting ATPase subunit b
VAEHQELINAMLSISKVLLTAGEETPRYQELVTLVPWNFIAQILNLFLQMFLIKKFLFKPIREVLEKRKAKADAEISDAVKAKEEALAMKAEYEQNMLEARDKANAILADATKTASAKSDEILKEASANAVAIKAKAEKDIEQEKRKAVNELKEEIGGMAMEIAGKVIEREINEEDHNKLINEFIEKVGEA